jgi:hypothetical protein
MWYTGSGNLICNQDLISTIKSSEANGYYVYVGSDSMFKNDRCVLATAICVYNPSFKRGGTFFYRKNFRCDPSLRVLANRMLFETQTAIDTAMLLRDAGVKNLCIHLDMGKDPKKNATSKVVDGLYGYVVGSGFDCEVKPYSWASSSVADRLSK